MTSHLQIAGQPLRRAQLNHAQKLIDRHPDWSRRRLSFELCGDWNWRDHESHLRLKECTRLLLELADQGKLRGIPNATGRGRSGWTKKDRWSDALMLNESPIESPLRNLGKIGIVPADRNPGDRLLYRHILAKYHPVGFKGPVGESMAYLIRDGKGRLLGALLFGSSAWSCRDRDSWIGWSCRVRQSNLMLTTNNTRFLILPWVKAPHLASHVLGKVIRRLNSDWIDKYGHPVHLLETFVDASYYQGTCYLAAGWQNIGKTCGRGCRAGKQATKSIKDILVRPLVPNFKKLLCHAPA